MERKLLLFLILLWGSYAPLSLPAAQNSSSVSASAATGVLKGRVQNAVTGRYVSKARVSVTQTDQVTFTDESGYFRLTRVPSGPAVIEVFFTGLEPQRISLTVPAGASVTRDVTLSGMAAGAAESAVQLDPFLVESLKDTDGKSIALNEQRFAPNLKNVVATDSHGDVVGGNSVADFLKYIPGVQVSGEQFESESAFVRGFPSNFTSVTADGAIMATSQVSGNSRNFNLAGISINNYSRVEVTKVPTPSTGADTMAGSVNMVTKNSFERSKAELRYQISLTGGSNHVTASKIPFIDESRQYAINPGFSFDYTLPVNDRFGVVVTAAYSNSFHDQLPDSLTWRTTGAGTNATVQAPFMGQWQLTDAPMFRKRASLGLRADWRVTRSSVLSVGTTASHFRSVWGNSNVTINAGTVGTPNPTTGVPFSYSPTQTIGATGRGGFTYNETHTFRTSANSGGNFRYRFDDGDWMLNLAGSISRARAWFRDAEDGAFNSISAVPKVPIRVEFLDIDQSNGRPRRVRVYNNANQEIDPYDPANFNVSAASMSAPRNIRVRVDSWSGDLKRRLNFLPFPASVQVGAVLREEERDIPEMGGASYSYTPANGDLSSAPFLAKVYKVQQKPFDFNNPKNGVPQLSPNRAYEAWQKNPTLFTMTAAQAVAAEVARLTGSEWVKEKVESLYIQPEARLFSGRLTVLTGVRYEKTTTGGKGPLQDAKAVFVRDPDGTFAHTATGARIRKPEAGAAGSLAETKLIYKERGYEANRTYDGLYPSLHLTYNATEKFLIRTAYAKTYGRPLFTDIIPRAVINENDVEDNPDPNVTLGTITIRNTALKPWTADNYDLSLEYYTEKGGMFGVSVFHKEIQDFFSTFAKVATRADLPALDLDERYVGWQVNTKFNAGDAGVSGLELSANQPLDQLGPWGKYFRVFANFTKLELKGDANANFTGFLPKSANWGITYSKKPFTIGAKWNYRGEQKTADFAAFGADGIEYWPSRIAFDLNLSYSLTPSLAVFINARDVLDKLTYKTYRSGTGVPDYAKYYKVLEHGTPFSIGLKGSF